MYVFRQDSLHLATVYSNHLILLKKKIIVSPSYLKLQVGLIKSCRRHEASDKLYISDIDINQESTIQVCSGLVPFIPIEQMSQRRVVVVTNMRNRKLRGEVSQGMILAAEKSKSEGEGMKGTGETGKAEETGGAGETNNTIVEPVDPPKSSIVGERLYFDGLDKKFEPPKLKDKVWEFLQPKLATNEKGQVVFEDKVLRGEKEEDYASVATLTNAMIK